MYRILPDAAPAWALILALAAAPAFAQSDADYLAARAAFDRADRLRLDTIAPKLAAHVLLPYVEFWQLKLKLDSAGDDEIRGYLARWPQTPFADQLRVEWLKVLGKRGAWTTFATEYPQAASEDVELGCYGIQYRRQRDGDTAVSAAKSLWFTGQSTPDACEPLFAALIASGALSPEDRRARFRLATEAGNTRLAQSIAVDLPPAERITAREFAQVDANPAAALAKGDFRWKRQGGRDLALYALERAARSEAERVHAAWVTQRSQLPVADRLYGNARIAFHAARQLNPQAADWYRETEGATLSEAQRAWRVRAALRAGAWPDVLATIDGMPRPEAQDPAWRYWRARALAAAGRVDEANMVYAGLAGDFSFYGLLPPRRSTAGGSRPRVRRSHPMPRRCRRSAHAAPCVVPSSWRSSTCVPNRSANGSTSCAGSPTKACCSPPTMRAARASTTARSTPPRGRPRATISACAT